MSFQIDLDKFDEAYGHFLHDIRDAIQRTFDEEVKSRGLTQQDIAEALGVDRSVVSKRLSGGGNITLKTICDLYTAMGRLPLSNYRVSHEDDAFRIGADVPRYPVSLGNSAAIYALFGLHMITQELYQTVNRATIDHSVSSQKIPVFPNQNPITFENWFLNRSVLELAAADNHG